MERFEFFFTIYSLLLGLALAELMLGYANLLRSPKRPAWGWLTPVLGVLIFLLIITSFLDAWLKLQQIQLNLVGLLTPTLVGVSYFVAAVMAVPRSATDWDSLDDYFHDRKKWILGLLAAQLVLTVFVTELPIHLDTAARVGWQAIHTEWVIANIVILALHLAPIFTRNYWANLLSMLGLIAIIFYYYGNFTQSMFEPAPAHAPAPGAASETPPGSPPPAPAR